MPCTLSTGSTAAVTFRAGRCSTAGCPAAMLTAATVRGIARDGAAIEGADVRAPRVAREGDDEELRRGSAAAGSDADRNPEFLLTCVVDVGVLAEVTVAGSAPASVGAARLCPIITAAIPTSTTPIIAAVMDSQVRQVQVRCS